MGDLIKAIANYFHYVVKGKKRQFFYSQFAIGAKARQNHQLFLPTKLLYIALKINKTHILSLLLNHPQHQSKLVKKTISKKGNDPKLILI